MHKSQIFFYFLIAFVAGVMSGSYFDISQTLAIWLMIPASTVILIFWRKAWVVVLAGLCLIFFVSGVIRFNNVFSKSTILAKFNDEVRLVKNEPFKVKVILRGYIDDEVSTKKDKQSFVFRTKEIEAGGKATASDERVLITTNIYP